jgi:iron complex outermembrane receptor protein
MKKSPLPGLFLALVLFFAAYPGPAQEGGIPGGADGEAEQEQGTGDGGAFDENQSAEGALTGDEDYELFPDYAPGITVTGRREPPAPSPVTPLTSPYGAHNVVGEEQIREQGSLDFLDALQNVPGVVAAKRNIVGTNMGSSLYIRGRGATHPSLDTVTSFDGVPRGGLVYGQSLADGISVFSAAAVEVYKSPQPSGFGAGYGMVNIQPKYMSREGREVRAGFSAGSYGVLAEHAAFGVRSGAFDVYGAQSWVSADGHVDHSAAGQQSYYLNLGYALNDFWNLRALADYTRAQTEQPRSTDQLTSDILSRYDTDGFLSTLTLNNGFEKASGFIKLYFNNTNFYWLHENGEPDDWSKQPMTAMGIKVRETFSLWKGNEWIGGLDLDKTQTANEDHNTPPRPSVYTGFPGMTLFSPYLAVSQYFGAPAGFHVVPSAGVRTYLHNIWDNQIVPQAGMVLGYGSISLNLQYSWGVVYPAPAAIQSLVNDAAAFAGADLKTVKPETVYHYEAGLFQNWPDLADLGVSWFFDDGRNRIIASWSPAAPDNDVSTASYFRISGIEWNGSITLTKELPFMNRLDLFAGGTWLWVRARGPNGKEARKLPYTPELSMSAGFTWTPFRGIRLSGDYQHLRGLYAGSLTSSANFSEPTETARMEDQHLLNFRISCTLHYKPWNVSEAEFFFAAGNVLNRPYEYYYNYKMPGLTFAGGINLRFN